MGLGVFLLHELPDTIDHRTAAIGRLAQEYELHFHGE
jgi:hypothetical protein